MSRLTLHRNHTRDLSPLARLLADPDDLTLVNPHAAQPFDPGEWAMKWVGERDDETFYLLDDAGLEVGFFALRVGIGPEVRHLTYVFVEERMRGGTGEELARLAETAARDLAPLARLLADPDDLSLVNPHAAHPFDPGEWAMKWVGERDDETFYLRDEDGREVGFFALRVGIGPEVRHLTYVFVEERMRGGSGEDLARLAEEAAQALGALTITLKVELDNEPALNLYRKAGYEELSRRGGMATMRRDLEG